MQRADHIGQYRIDLAILNVMRFNDILDLISVMVFQFLF